MGLQDEDFFASLRYVSRRLHPGAAAQREGNGLVRSCRCVPGCDRLHAVLHACNVTIYDEIREFPEAGLFGNSGKVRDHFVDAALLEKMRDVCFFRSSVVQDQYGFRYGFRVVHIAEKRDDRFMMMHRQGQEMSSDKPVGLSAIAGVVGADNTEDS
ncbi:hypothetical protein G6M70_21085 [Agrobacterium tumefaciens]|uniref:hypothetical protein n=1 Tax=Agrobacterium tumefaciens TaxID=358 RepID=UPI001300DF1F|nr:hypothetical protein [Agrobacterium tumefaciens]NSY98039.1 hypothetical protein [Agrobacterium tumefaciens]NSZ03808.1 hypothetical protein [Agrobacterium tumefaciens]NSZ39368.1 hypothetical protein [Agrobacterium tumefaciens]NTB04573.1 hypothetical protein [Agrobacterium tumefaciens]NTB23511.1 hypothetical protein [Agrobacterium tumefaciens]